MAGHSIPGTTWALLPVYEVPPVLSTLHLVFSFQPLLPGRGRLEGLPPRGREAPPRDYAGGRTTGSRVVVMQRNLRASNAEREAVVERLERAVAEGRITMAEFEERVTAAYAALTHGDLEPLVADLPRSLW
jgi:hypothetical protein